MGLGTKSLALDKGITKVGAFRVHPKDQAIAKDGTRLEYAYYADETDTYWLVSENSLFIIGAKDLDYYDWAEGDKTAKEFGRRSPERL